MEGSTSIEMETETETSALTELFSEENTDVSLFHFCLLIGANYFFIRMWKVPSVVYLV